MIFFLIGCASTNLKYREIPNALRVQENPRTNEFEVCDPSTGAWKCDRFSKKTLVQKELNSDSEIDRQCIESQYELGPITGPLMSRIEFKDQGQYFLTQRQLKSLRELASLLQHEQIIILGFSDENGLMNANTFVAQQRAYQISKALQKFGLAKNMISLEGQASRCIQPGINNKRALIFKV